MQILITGGLGYIGSHIATKAISEGYEIIILDNLSNSSFDTLSYINNITNKENIFYDYDIRNQKSLAEVFKNNNIQAIIHCAGLKSVNESFAQKNLYQNNNVEGSSVLFKTALEFGIKKIIFSSSAAVYGQPSINPIKETDPSKPECPYGQNKVDIEAMLQSLCKLHKNLSCISLRYFNPLGAHKSGLIGDYGLKKPANIFPLICKAALDLSVFKVNGQDYDTPDGTCIRDYIHIDDLVSGHLSALDYTNNFIGHKAVNLGRGEGVSVIELLSIFKKEVNNELKYCFGDRRKGDAAMVFANPSLANKIFNWKAKKSIIEMIHDGWKWEKSKYSRNNIR